jgi:nucleoside-diphosphate-sugar epimerase
LSEKNLGHVIYCIGLTADFRTRPFDTVEAHVCKLKNILQDSKLESLVYLSSTRVYDNRQGLSNEEGLILTDPNDFNNLYNISKIMGEAVCNASPKKTYILRLSNVYGNDLYSDNFLTAVIRDAVSKKKVELQTTLDSEKDYISVQDVAELILKITRGGKHTIYNIASGKNITNFEIMEKLKELTSCEVTVAQNAKKISFPRIDNSRIRNEFSFRPTNLLDDLRNILNDYTVINSNYHVSG